MSHSTDRLGQDGQVNPGRVARRALVMSAVVSRGSIDAGVGQAEAESLPERILKWLEQLELEASIEPPEYDILHAPLGKLTDKQVIEATWSVEGLSIMSWALCQLDLPRHDQQVDPYVVAESLRFLREDAAELIESEQQRSNVELEAYRELVYAIHCRINAYARKKERADFTRWVEQAWLDMLAIDPAQLIVDGDLSIDGMPIGDIKPDRLQSCGWVANERHRASIWLLGGYPVYSNTPVDT